MLRAVQRGEFPPPRRLDPSIDPALEAVCLKAMATEPGGPLRLGRALADDVERWAADEPVAAYPEPLVRRARRWAEAEPHGGDGRGRGAGGRGDRADGGPGGADAGQDDLARANDRLRESLGREERANSSLAAANAELASANTRVKQRYDLAVAAIKTFHTGVSEDFLLKEDKFKALRDRLLRSAGEFYGKLSSLLGRETDLASRCALAQSNFELADLTLRVGRLEDAARGAPGGPGGAGALAAESPDDHGGPARPFLQPARRRVGSTGDGSGPTRPSRPTTGPSVP